MKNKPNYKITKTTTVTNVESYINSIDTTVELGSEIKKTLARYKELSNDFYYGEKTHAVEGKAANRAQAKRHHHHLEAQIFEYLEEAILKDPKKTFEFLKAGFYDSSLSGALFDNLGQTISDYQKELSSVFIPKKSFQNLFKKTAQLNSIENISTRALDFKKSIFDETDLAYYPTIEEPVLRFSDRLETTPHAVYALFLIDCIHLKMYMPFIKNLQQKHDLLQEAHNVLEHWPLSEQHTIQDYFNRTTETVSFLGSLESSIKNLSNFYLLDETLNKNNARLESILEKTSKIKQEAEIAKQKQEAEQEIQEKARREREERKVKQKAEKEAELQKAAEELGIEQQEQETLAFEEYSFDDSHSVFHRIKKKALVDYDRIRNEHAASQAKDLALRIDYGLNEIIALSEIINIFPRHTKELGDSIFADDLLRVYEKVFLDNREKSNALKMNDSFSDAIKTAQEKLSALIPLAKQDLESDALKAAAQDRYNSVFLRDGAYPHPDQATKDAHIQKIAALLNKQAQNILKTLERTPMLAITLTGNEQLILKTHKLFNDMQQISYLEENAAYKRDLLQYKINKMAEKALTNLLGYDMSFAGEEPQEPKPEEKFEELEQEPESLSEQEQEQLEEDTEPETIIETVMQPTSGGITIDLGEGETKSYKKEQEQDENKIENDPVFQKLVKQTDEFVLRALVHEIQRNAFKCVLELKQGYPIKMTLSDKNKESSSISLKPETDNLDRALELKIALQSYVLNNNDLIFPYRNITANKKAISVEMDEPMPISEPNNSVLVRGGGIYRVGMNFTERRKPLDVSFSLGVISTPENIDLAKERMQLLMEYLSDERARKRWITKREAINFVRSFYKKEEWAKTESTYLQGYDEITDLPVLSLTTNSPMKLSRVLLRYEDGANPSYILNYKVSINDDIQRGAGIRLHTASEELAIERAHEAIESLQAIFSRKAEEGAVLSLDEQGNWVAVPEEERDKKIDRKGLSDIFRDTKHFETTVAVKCAFSATQERKDDFEAFTLNITRNCNDNEPETVRDLDGNVVEFKAHATNRKAANAFANAVNQTFENYIQDAYSTRTTNGLRKTPQKYHTKTAPNLLIQAIETHKAEFQDTIIFE